jgi:pyruvate formate lyase activating enzyme
MKEEPNLNEIPRYYKLSQHQEKHSTGVKCILCPHSCIIKENRTGICRTMKNHKGEIYSISYGNPCAVNVDPIEKKPLFHFMPGEKVYSLATAGCNFSCINCQNSDISQSSPEETDNYELLPEEIVKQAIKHNTKMIAYTYTEPFVFYEYMFDTAKIAHEKGLKNVLISNGYINEKPLRELCKYIDAANINLKAFDDSVHKKITGGGLKHVLNTLKVLKEENIWLEITNLIVPSLTDKPDMIKKMCEWLYVNGFADAPLHFSRFFPTYKLKHLPVTPELILIEARKIAMQAGIKYVYIGNMPGNSADNTFCDNCKKVLIERSGFNIGENKVENGKCKFCGEKIIGVWE